MSVETAPSPLVAGVLAVALLVAGTRWSSHLGVNPLYLSDLLIAAAVWNLASGAGNAAKRYPLAEQRPPYPTFTALVALWAVARFVVGTRFDLVAVRDFMPYLYAAVALLGWAAVRRSTVEGRERTRRILMAALWFHFAWSFVVLAVWPALPSMLPVVNAAQGLHVFSPRRDVDGALNGVLAAILLLRFLRGEARRPGWTIAAIVGCWAAILGGVARAGLLGAAVVTVAALVAYLTAPTTARTLKRKQLFVAVAPMLLVAVAVALPSTTVGDRLLGTFGVSSSDEASAERQSASGTAGARSAAWDQLTAWTLQDPSRAVFGAGFGPNVLAESGASELLVNTLEEGETIPRSPHNYWVGTFARLGLIGVALAAFATLGLVVRSWRQRRELSDDPLRFLLMAIALSLIVPATIGVVFESPFGAVPFWWCLGAVMALPRTPVAAPMRAGRKRSRTSPRSGVSSSGRTRSRHLRFLSTPSRQR